jgi:biopolymer transport protein ExbD
MRFAQRLETRSAMRRQNKLYCSIEASAHAGILLALLFLFMVQTTSYHDLPTHAVDLVSSRHSTPMPRALREDAMRITIQRDGGTFFGDYRIQPDDLPDRIRDALQNGAEKKVYLAVDARTKYGNVAKILAQVRLAEVDNVCFLVN